MKNKKV